MLRDLDLSGLKPEPSDVHPYHYPRKTRANTIDPEKRPFIAWDGEGQNLRGIGKPQSYVLFGCSTGDVIVSDKHIHTFQLLDFVISVGRDNPTAFHVGFAFGYDANMIVQSLSEESLRLLHKRGHVNLQRPIFGRYRIEYRPGKWFQVTKYGEHYHPESNSTDKITVKIYDLFGFFTKKFVKAYEELIGSVPEAVREGKDRRNEFASESLEYIEHYWRIEIEMLRELADELRRRLYGAGLRITSWHGPGALASYALRQHKVKDHMAECPALVREAARYAYAGGRFEVFKLGRTLGPIYSVDINSAYPYGISMLPSLRSGKWIWTGNVKANKIARFGVYRVRLHPTPSGSFVERAPGPLFHRDAMGNISFPWVLEGWYWSPEVRNLAALPNDRYEIVEGWEYVGHKQSGVDPPFDWVKEVYQTRREWKAQGLSTQLALKLLLNSIYGKLAQRVGWNEETREAPPFHQLEWAGWVTSLCRAILWDVMARIPREHVIAVETDGLYTTYPPDLLGIENSAELGGWEVEVYDEILYVQSGMAWLRKGDTWTCKRRGLDARTFEKDACVSYLQSLRPGEIWDPYIGQTTRFVGMGSALVSEAPTKVRHCVWSTTEREIRPGQGGKRVHLYKQCNACANGKTAFDEAHDMSIRSMAYKDPMSHPHDIPWEDDGIDYEWRRYSESLGESISP